MRGDARHRRSRRPRIRQARFLALGRRAARRGRDLHRRFLVAGVRRVDLRRCRRAVRARDRRRAGQVLACRCRRTRIGRGSIPCRDTFRSSSTTCRARRGMRRDRGNADRAGDAADRERRVSRWPRAWRRQSPRCAWPRAPLALPTGRRSAPRAAHRHGGSISRRALPRGLSSMRRTAVLGHAHGVGQLRRDHRRH